MEYFWKTVALALIGVLLWIVLQKRNQDISILLSLSVCCVITGTAVFYIHPILELLWELSGSGNLDETMLGYLLQAAGIGLISEMIGRICNDAGNASIGGVVRFAGSAAMLYCSIPMIRTLIALIQNLVGVI